jgi:microcin C transport system permease protein
MIESLLSSELKIRRWRRFKRNKLAVLSSILLFIMMLVSFTASFWANDRPLYIYYKGQHYFPFINSYSAQDLGIKNAMVVDYKNLELSKNDKVIWPVINWGPNETNIKVDSFPSSPTTENLLGTDNRGRDVLTRLLYGFRYSMIFSFSVWFFSISLGIIFGGVMGYLGGLTDFLGQRVVEIISTVPQFFLLLIIVSIFEPTLIWLVFISALFGWIPLSYYVRGEFLKNRKKDFVESAQAMGSSHTRIIFKHILPNSLTPLITYTPFILASNIVALAGLDFLGFGLTPPTPSWGELLNQAKQYFTVAWWLAVYPSLFLFLTLSLLGLIGEGVRDALDPYA